ncbi:short-chain dehydrogenase [Bordetella genomosp. 8]|uniref:Short-chain dehydrogenase n=1 Tax=Bordetella genomosp. 8 TaxID=1416806 RepID=A0A1W6YP60_9BORD|nr:SDR family oxidoreductase [Bordetella genomosp. 8]ARP82880.1 short-chain dehydrogenase [Bordetella genomosp. 8]
MFRRTNAIHTVVITGASAGVGRATALEFARRGANVALLARDAEALAAAAEDVRKLGVRALPIPVDVSDAKAMHHAADQVEAELGPIDVWVNNAMLTVFSPLSKLTPEEFARVTEVTYLGQVYGTMAALRHMRRRDRGTIVQVGSALAYRAIPLQSAYCGAKHGVRGFTDSLRSELMHDRSRVHVTMVQMPALNTPQFDWAKSHVPYAPQPVPPIFQPEVAARAIVWAAHHRRRELYVGMPSIKAIVANKFFPGLLDWYLARTNYEAQRRKPLAPATRVDNLWRPVSGRHGTHGSFDDQAQSHSAALWASTHRPLVVGAGVALGALLWTLWKNRD